MTLHQNASTPLASTLLTSAVIATLTLAGCGDDPTGPVGSATVSAFMTDGSASPQAASRAPTASDGVQPASSLNGSMSGSAQVYLYSETRGWVAVGSPQSTTLALQSNARSSVSSEAQVPAGTYTKVRLVLDGFSAHLNAGSVLGDLTLGAAVSITMGGTDGHVEIEKEVGAFTVEANADADIEFDMNSEIWVHAQSAQSESATDADIRGAATAKAIVQ